ncbi:hypothetical protein [Candidatus Chlorohelix sp.]|uniref:hypothetical protein n=1 Tax=Candidatus Chlorohelix sp. TaxID=3139201 RepID=UPI003055CEB3
MDPSIIFVVMMVIAVIIFTVVNSRNKGGRNVCTRCDGTGEVHEKWPDPDAPNGWHILDGICPKCKGKGKV